MVGIVLVIPVLQTRLSLAIAPLGIWFVRRFGGRTKQGLTGQFGVGVLLGAVWTPCVGPTLGAASVFAAQGRDLFQVTLTMLLFAVGTALPLLVFGLVSRGALIRWGGGCPRAIGTFGKMALGLMLVGTGALILTGYDKPLETALLRLTPEWLTEITTRF
jgi:cytochrome c biogenesis protein CcdA